MDTKTEVRDFLTSRRAKITPAEAGLTTYGTRQVPGLRREEVATLAGASVDYYSRMERGNLAGVIDAMTGAAAFVVNSRQDILAANQLGRAFYAPVLESPAPANMARFTYVDPRARDFFTDWSRTVQECVAALRTQAGRDPLDRGLSDLIGALSTQSEEFAALWATHDVRLHRKTEKNFNHPVPGELTLR
ncbi:MAG TPA: hypothetical protein VIZ43_16135 [Trebonia sp.]